MSPPHFSPDTAAVSLTPPFPVLAPPFRLITPTAALDPLRAYVCSRGTSLPRIILVVPHSPRLHAFSLNPLVSARSAPSAPSSSTDCLFSHDHRAFAIRPCPRSPRATVFSLRAALTVCTDTWTCCSLRHVFSLLYWTLRLMSVLCFCLPGKEYVR